MSGPADSFYRRIHEFFWSHLGSIADLDVLDLGCGHGWPAEQMRQAGARVTDVAAALPDGGAFVFSILHPAFFSQNIVDEGPGGERYRKVTG
ncbi:hypothetical protein ACFXPS_04105 [Nocardia sp. NPDC059091]|uniref:hypothetical protein n=1 Tax=unclassified Nocardia TaxID=2637762 RepID=UPI0036CD4232